MISFIKSGKAAALYVCPLVLFVIMLTDFLISFFEAIKVSKFTTHLDKLEEYLMSNETARKIKTRLMEAYPYLVKRNNKLLDKLKKLKNSNK